MKCMSKSLLGVFLVCLGLTSFGQTATQCSRALTAAEQAFEQGRLLFILDEEQNKQFYECLEGGGFTKEEEIRAHKLLTKAYLFTDNEEEAERKLVDLLIADKEHQLSKEDPAELHFLYSKFKTEPILRVAGRIGLNKSFVSVIQEYNALQGGFQKKYNQEGENTGFGLDLWAEILVERHIANGIEIAAGPQLRFATYEIEGQLIENNLTYLAKNKSTMLRVPLLVRYNFGYDAKTEDENRKKFIPYVFLGGSYDLMLNAKYVDTNRTGGTALTLADDNGSLSDFDQVATQNASIFGGVGFKLRVGRALVDFFTVELRYDNSLFNYINPENRWANQDVNIGIGHIEDDLTINTASISIGYTRSFYIPRKRKQYR
ncbi:MAG: hypothetical protein Tsb0034_23680 [Ekhidna sp.]